MPLRECLVVSLVALVPFVLAVPAAAQFAPVKGREYREFVNPVNPVRGEAVVGVAVLPTAEALASRTVEVWLPDRFMGELQVETLTADGRFRGEGVFTGASPGGQWMPLTLGPAGPAAGARPSNPATLALAVRGPESVLFVARWATSASRPAAQVRLYVNGRRADTFVRAGERVIRCSPVGIPQPLRFDAVCDVPASDIPADGKLVLIRRDQFDEQSQTVTVNTRGLR